MKFRCYACDDELTQPGALLFSPPTNLGDDPMEVEKYHLCGECYKDIYGLMLHGPSYFMPRA